MKKQMSSLGPTAYLTAYHRSFSDIPFSKEILEYLTQTNGPSPLGEVLKPGLAPQLEARYKLIDRLVNQAGYSQILEIASGFSPRGMIMSSDSRIQYVEVDVEMVAREKKALIEHLKPGCRNLHVEVGSGLNYQDLAKACQHFQLDLSVTITHEGLLRYLSFDQKAVVAQNIGRILREYGGVWITSDISLQETQEAENRLTPGIIEKVSHTTGANLVQNRFRNEEHAHQFFEELGFTIERHSFLEMTAELTSPGTLNISPKQVEEMNGAAVVFVMHPV